MIDQCPECSKMYDRHLFNDTCPKCHPATAFSGIMCRMCPELESVTTDELLEMFNDVRGRG